MLSSDYETNASELFKTRPVLVTDNSLWIMNNSVNVTDSTFCLKGATRTMCNWCNTHYAFINDPITISNKEAYYNKQIYKKYINIIIGRHFVTQNIYRRLKSSTTLFLVTRREEYIYAHT